MDISHIPGRILPALVIVLLLIGCGKADDTVYSSSDSGSGALTLRITDAPVDSAEHVYVKFHGLELQSAGGTRITLYYCQDPADATRTVVSTAACGTLAAPKQIDLLALTGGLAVELLDGHVLPAGRYDWIRLLVDTTGLRDSYVVTAGGAEVELIIPNGGETGFTLARGFHVPDGGSADLTVDFDLRKSVHVTRTGEYLLHPSLRLADNALAGAIAGTVDPSRVPVGCTPAVYVFAGAGIAPDDIDDTASDPVTTATVKLDNGSGAYRYKAAFLEAGDYTVAYTCQGAADDPARDDALTFTGTATMAVIANTVTRRDF